MTTTFPRLTCSFFRNRQGWGLWVAPQPWSTPRLSEWARYGEARWWWSCLASGWLWHGRCSHGGPSGSEWDVRMPAQETNDTLINWGKEGEHLQALRQLTETVPSSQVSKVVEVPCRRRWSSASRRRGWTGPSVALWPSESSLRTSPPSDRPGREAGARSPWSRCWGSPTSAPETQNQIMTF